MKKGTDSRSLETEEQLFTITLEDALALLAQPKPRGAAATAKPPLRELGAGSGQQQAGRAQGGPLRAVRHRRRDEREPAAAGDDPETVTIERAAELLADRRSKGPAPKKKRGGGRRSAA